MGITQLSLNRIDRYLKPESKILIIGCQNCYWADNYGEIAHTYFKALGHDVKSIDILGCNGSEVADLREDLGFKPEYGMIMQHGTIEHCDCDTLYIPFLNMHNACKVGGIMIHENPKQKNWPLHGSHYFTEGFYRQLSYHAKYDLLEITSEASMNNFVDGWNVSTVLRKTKTEFIAKKQFNQIYSQTIFKS